MAEARAASDNDLLRLAELFEAESHGSLVEEVIRDRLNTSRDGRLSNG